MREITRVWKDDDTDLLTFSKRPLFIETNSFFPSNPIHVISITFNVQFLCLSAIILTLVNNLTVGQAQVRPCRTKHVFDTGIKESHAFCWTHSKGH
ncbi:hypothetical protein Ciccas_003860 [Cichlidogyrus casuarinus]|uniref:Uncharacterized protein n=1 Tax=Cichlidogyrus casuarinus TaxID=1844966 RepID=A0ABD2QGI0_9PLAT